MEKKYTVEVYVTHIEEVYAEDEDDASRIAQEKVFDEKVEYDTKGELITGYRVRDDEDIPF